MSENQYSENKEVFGEDVMKYEVIPKTVQSFLNAEGGYLYIGVKDEGTLQERVVGLAFDREIIEKSKGGKLSIEKFQDYLEMELNDILTKYLAFTSPIGPLIEINYPEINGKNILEIHIAKSPAPFFFKNLTRKNLPKKFDIRFANDTLGQRFLDDFYIRSGGKKRPLETFEQFYNYFKEHWLKI